ncbi:alkaline ceramidase-like protein [Apiospora aurea]|uniref:Alkaline ceramidase-like protein n=1 Tax=Apiospora aurea TaxID=335848 RepID=A0ABR1QD50_9PEZI
MDALFSLGIPYREPGLEGWWGEKTVTLNFCEEDYVMSHYVAEVCNVSDLTWPTDQQHPHTNRIGHRKQTLTNALFIWLGYKGIRDCIKYSHPWIFFVAFMGYTVVGMGSTFFHATLKYPMQLVDELAMIYTTCFMCYATFSYGRSRSISAVLGVALTGLSYYITERYYRTKDPQFHQDAYGILTAIVVFSNMYIIETQVRPALRARQEKRAPNPAILPADAIVKQMWAMVITGLAIFLGGFLIWNLDNIYCQTITRWRRQIGLPLAMLLEGHAWWHVMTGIAYYYITWRVWIHRCLDGDEDKFQLKWPTIWRMPEVVAIQEVQNGKATKKHQ